MPETTGAPIGSRFSGLGDELKETATGVAETMTDQFDRGVKTARQLGDRASETIGKASEYFRETHMRDMSEDLAAYVKSHPLQALAGAAILGFLAGRLLSRE